MGATCHCESEERVGLMVDAEWTDREQRKLARGLCWAKNRQKLLALLSYPEKIRVTIGLLE